MPRYGRCFSSGGDQYRLAILNHLIEYEYEYEYEETPPLRSSVTCHVSFGDSNEKVMVPPNCQCFPRLFVLVLVLDR